MTTKYTTIPLRSHDHETVGQGGQIDHGLGLSGLADVDHAVDAAVGTGSLRTLGSGALQGLPGASHILVRKTADEAVDNSATMQNDDHFSFAIAANEVWFVELCLIVDGMDTGGMDCTWSLPTDGTFASRHIGAEPDQTSTGVVVAASNLALIASGAEVRVVADAATVDITAIIMKFTIVNGANAGTAQFQWAQASNTVGPTNIHSESYMIAHRL